MQSKEILNFSQSTQRYTIAIYPEFMDIIAILYTAQCTP